MRKGRGATNKEFFFYANNEDQVILEPPKDYKPMTQERFQQLIDNQSKWREEYNTYKKENTYSKNYYNTIIKAKKKSSLTIE
jgi:hypothetical protein